MPTYAVTGASGHLGHEVVVRLLGRGVPAADVVAVLRTPEKVADLAERGVQVRRADYSEPDTLPAALAGVDTLLLVSGSEPGKRLPQHTAVIEAAKAAGVGRIVYTSILHADTTPNPLAPEHKATEEALRGSGLAYTMLRNSWYTENYSSQLGQYVERGEILGAAGTGRVSAATRADYAGAAVAALLRTDDVDAVYELGGPSFDFGELAAAVSAVTGQPVTYRDVSVPEYVAALQAAGLDEGTAGFVAAIDDAIAQGALETTSSDLTDLLGRPATPLEDALRAAKA